MKTYKSISQQVFSNEEYYLVPIRDEDKYRIMDWRNEQIDHLRQTEPLTREQQDNYFGKVISKLFIEEFPDQILFSFLKNDLCIGYGGLVHINWENRNAEISFIMDTNLEESSFKLFWLEYLALIEQVAFNELKLKKIYTYAYDFRSNLFDVLIKARYREEGRLKKHIKIGKKYIDVILHYKINNRLKLRKASRNDARLTYDWFLDKKIREFSYSRSKVTFSEHSLWFEEKLKSKHCLYLIAETADSCTGSIRGDLSNAGIVISFLVDSSHHGFGLGKSLLKEGVEVLKQNWPSHPIIAYVQPENKASRGIFESLNFRMVELSDKIKYVK